MIEKKKSDRVMIVLHCTRDWRTRPVPSYHLSPKKTKPSIHLRRETVKSIPGAPGQQAAAWSMPVYLYAPLVVQIRSMTNAESRPEEKVLFRKADEEEVQKNKARCIPSRRASSGPSSVRCRSMGRGSCRGQKRDVGPLRVLVVLFVVLGISARSVSPGLALRTGGMNLLGGTDLL